MVIEAYQRNVQCCHICNMLDAKEKTCLQAPYEALEYQRQKSGFESGVRPISKPQTCSELDRIQAVSES